MANNLEARTESVSRITVSYNIFHWLFYPSNWSANFPVRPLQEKYAEVTKYHPRFIGEIASGGEHLGSVTKFNRGGDQGKAFYGAAIDTSRHSLDNLVDWCEDPPLESELNRGRFSHYRKTAMVIQPPGGGKAVHLEQYKPSLFQSWYGLPFKLMVSAVAFPFTLVPYLGSYLRRTSSLFGKKKEQVELGKLYNVTGLASDALVLDQDFIATLRTLGLGKYYDLRDNAQNVVARVKRSPLIKLLTLGLKDYYVIEFKQPVQRGTALYIVGFVDYLNREGEFRRKRPRPDLPTGNLFRHE
ncbi:hypothetical protein HYW21_09410 [Candidatus Woesearchaeota archaeon]|nr:hypothetical protein [Candidatus Woesearchaeota archaeon]